MQAGGSRKVSAPVSMHVPLSFFVRLENLVVVYHSARTQALLV